MYKWLFPATTFLGAFLLFVAEPMTGKLVLPIFGGSAMVWVTVMLFFTTILFFGYGYVVWLRRLEKKIQFFIHICLLIISLVGTVFGYLRFTSDTLLTNPILSLLYILISNFALPTFVLATTSVLLQCWYSDLYRLKSPYWLYIVSNAGSLFGLLLYPFLIEPFLSIKTQWEIWIGGFLLFCVLMTWGTVLFYKNVSEKNVKRLSYKATPILRFTWFVLPFISTAAMLSFTTQLTSQVSPIPFVWVATLGVYLLSFVFAFIDTKWYPKWFFEILLLCLVPIVGLLAYGLLAVGYLVVFCFYLFFLFVIDLVCNRALFVLRPSPEGLSNYYLLNGLGGVGASIFTAIIAPNLFTDIWEFPLVIIMAAGVAGIILIKSKFRKIRAISMPFALASGVVFIVLFLRNQDRLFGGNDVTALATMRNFYGVLHVLKKGKSEPYQIQLYNGYIIHGDQTFGVNQEFVPSTYYTRESGLGITILNHPKSIKKMPLKIGTIGLGTGTVATYCGKGSSIRFYEINPQVITVAENYFTYLSNAKKNGCNVEIVQGDGRTSLTNELKKDRKNNFDVLIVDAFTGDTIPTHLLTEEAIDLYLSNLSEEGVIAVHVSNKYLDLAPVLKSEASIKKLYFQLVEKMGASWVILSRSIFGSESFLPGVSTVKPWTDDYSNLFQVLRK